MTCRKCGSKIPADKLGCMHCARVAQVMSDRQNWKRLDAEWFRWIHEKDWATLWVAVERQEDGTIVHHFAQESLIDFMTISFCGLGLSIGGTTKDANIVMGGQQKPDFRPDPRNCPLCWDRLINRGGGICADICLACGGKDGTHRKKCSLAIPEPGEKLPMEEQRQTGQLSDELKEVVDAAIDAHIEEKKRNQP